MPLRRLEAGQCPIVAAHQQKILAHLRRRGGTCHAGLGQICQPLPAKFRLVTPGVVQIRPGHFSVGRLQSRPAKKVKSIFPRGGHGQNARLAGTSRHLFPGWIFLGQRQRKNLADCRLFAGMLRAAGHVNSGTHQSASRIGERQGQGREIFNQDFAVQIIELIHLAVVAISIAAADDNQPLAGGNGNAVRERTRKFSHLHPAIGFGRQPVNFIVPDFFTAFPGHPAGEIGPARHQQRIAANARKGARHAQSIGQGRQLRPMQRLVRNRAAAESKGNHKQG